MGTGYKRGSGIERRSRDGIPRDGIALVFELDFDSNVNVWDERYVRV